MSSLKLVYSKPADHDLMRFLVPHVSQMSQYMKLRQTRQSGGLGTCSSSDLQNFLRGYPPECAATFLSLPLNGLGLSDASPAFFELFADVLCNERCGQPVVDAFYDCEVDAIADALVLSCSVNENGALCGSILNSTVDAFEAAGRACNCSSGCLASSCSVDCQSALRSLRDSAGCCGNLENLELAQPMDSESRQREQSLYDVAADLCGIGFPSPCSPGALSASLKTSTVAKATVLGLTLLAVTVLLF